MNLTEGNPAPSACYSGQPFGVINESSLISPVINAIPFSCGQLILTFDYKMEIQSSLNYDEDLNIEINPNGTWMKVAKLEHLAPCGWTSRAIDLTPVRDHVFQIRFRVAGLTNYYPATWFLDNIRIEFQCTPPQNFQAEATAGQVLLSWSPPACDWQGYYFGYDDGTPETVFSPVPGEDVWAGIRYGQSKSEYKLLDALIGSSDPFLPPFNTWLSVPLFGLQVEGAYYLMVHWDSLTGLTNEIGHDESNSYSYGDICFYFDGTTWSTFSSVTGFDLGVFLFRPRRYYPDDMEKQLGFARDSAIQQVPRTNGMIQATPTPESLNIPETTSLTGYNLYRTDQSGLPPYSRLNLDPLSDTGYIDILSPGISSGVFRYYVTSLFHDTATSAFICESFSDTILVEPYTGIEPVDHNRLTLWPNPTTGKFSLYTQDRIHEGTLVSVLGVTYPCSLINGIQNSYLIDISDYLSGIYLLKIQTASGILTEKVVKL